MQQRCPRALIDISCQPMPRLLSINGTDGQTDRLMLDCFIGPVPRAMRAASVRSGLHETFVIGSCKQISQAQFLKCKWFGLLATKSESDSALVNVPLINV